MSSPSEYHNLIYKSLLAARRRQPQPRTLVSDSVVSIVANVQPAKPKETEEKIERQSKQKSQARRVSNQNPIPTPFLTTELSKSLGPEIFTNRNPNPNPSQADDPSKTATQTDLDLVPRRDVAEVRSKAESVYLSRLPSRESGFLARDSIANTQIVDQYDDDDEDDDWENLDLDFYLKYRLRHRSRSLSRIAAYGSRDSIAKTEIFDSVNDSAFDAESESKLNIDKFLKEHRRFSIVRTRSRNRDSIADTEKVPDSDDLIDFDTDDSYANSVANLKADEYDLRHWRSEKRHSVKLAENRRTPSERRESQIQSKKSHSNIHIPGITELTLGPMPRNRNGGNNEHFLPQPYENSKEENDILFYCFDCLISQLNHLPMPKGLKLPERQVALFVKWRKGEKLRGCIGSFYPFLLREGLQKFAIESATKDKRFPSIKRKEIKSLQVIVSKVEHFQEIIGYLDWEIGRHGIYIHFIDEFGEKLSASLLPDIALVNGWTKTEAVEALLQKSGYKGKWSPALHEIIKLKRFETNDISTDYKTYKEHRRNSLLRLDEP